MVATKTILVLGDVHGVTNCLNLVPKRLENLGLNIKHIHEVWQLGDLGIWEITNLDPLRKLSTMPKNGFHFVRGNHEQYQKDGHPYFDKMMHQLQADEFLPIFDHDGHTWQFTEKCTALCLGGAISIDAAYRTAGIDWFPQDEDVCEEYVEQRLDDDSFNVVISHDFPSSWGSQFNNVNNKHGWGRVPGNDKLDRLYQNRPPRLWIHGHHHQSYIAKDDRSGTIFAGVGSLHDDGDMLIMNINEETISLRLIGGFRSTVINFGEIDISR